MTEPITPYKAKILQKIHKEERKELAIDAFNNGLSKGKRLFIVNDHMGRYIDIPFLSENELKEVIDKYKGWNIKYKLKNDDPFPDGLTPPFVVKFEESEA